MNMLSLAPLGYSNYAITESGQVWSCRKQRFMHQFEHRCRYMFVQLVDDSGIAHNRYTHRLVALMFIPTQDTTLQIDHIDGNKHNNHYTNLRWVTNRENAHAAMRTGLMPHAVFMTDEVVHEICKAISNGEPIASISRRLGYPASAIYAIRLKRNWTHISDQYVFPPTRKRNVTPDDTVHVICKMIASGYTDSYIAKETSISGILVNRIRNKQNFKHISDQYF